MRTDLSFGVEEEFLVVDPLTRAVVPRAAEVIRRAKASLGDRVAPEITHMQVEVRTEPCVTAAGLHDQLREGRETLAVSAAAAGLAVIASGSAILGSVAPAAMTEGPRQDRGNETFRALHDEVTICAAHVHVEMPDRERALLVGNHLRPHLPTLIALTANSPYWAGRDTGYASWRTLTCARWPVAGPPPFFASEAHYDDVVGALLAAGALVDEGTIFWDIRPSAHLPTLEIRATDTPLTATDTALLAVLVRALAATALRLVERGDPGPRIPAEILRAAYWRAARDGLEGHALDVLTGRLAPAADLVRQSVAYAAAALGPDLGLVTGWLDQLTAGGSGAARQRRAGADGDLVAVVDYLVGMTAGRAVLPLG
ncbi:carboxylate-amine ligase [Actinokineospora sp.]|uniref:carboxylate-amine ligase n=1 Tax=Actinokineospora sp. TaxID=1872133 RepID=UPI003D6A17D1